MAFLKPDTQSIPAPQQPAQPPPVLSPQGTKPGAKNQRSTFLGADSTPQSTMPGGGGKTLLGS